MLQLLVTQTSTSAVRVALLQLQAYWWQAGQISQAISAMVGQGGLNAVLVDPVLKQLSNVTANIEIPLNIALLMVFLVIGIGIAVARAANLFPKQTLRR